MASRVRESYSSGVDCVLSLALNNLRCAGPVEWRRLGDPLAIAAETELVSLLGKRLRAARWQAMSGSSGINGGFGSVVDPYATAMVNVDLLFTCICDRLNYGPDLVTTSCVMVKTALKRMFKQARHPRGWSSPAARAPHHLFVPMNLSFDTSGTELVMSPVRLRNAFLP